MGQFRILRRSSYSISPRLCPYARRDALLWTFSSAKMSLASHGHQTGAAYSRIGRSKVFHRVASTFEGPSVLYSICLYTTALHDKSEEKRNPRTFVHLTGVIPDPTV